MSSDTLSTTFRLLNHFTSPCATSPSIPQSRPVSWRTARRACALGRASCPLAGISDGLHAFLGPALHHRAVLREVDRDGVAAHDVVVLPDAGVAEQDHALLEVEVLGALGRGGAAVARDDADAARRDGAEHAVALLVEVDLHPVRVLDRVVLPGDDVTGEDDEALLAQPLHPVGVHREGLAPLVLRLGAAR